jgi:mxaA protein
MSLTFVLAAALAVVEQPRSFGYVVGDVVTQRVLLEERGRAFTPDPLPAAGPLGNWVERRAAHIEGDARGRRWLVVEYQIMNSPPVIQLVTLPAWKLAGLSIPEWQISVAPLTPEQPFAKGGLGGLRPDRAPPTIVLAPIHRWMMIWLGCALALVLWWAGWWAWRNWRASTRQPFAKALREIRALDEQSSQAWVALHRAFDATAGRVVQAETLPSMFAQAPRFKAERAAIEQFFAQSSARFFDARSEARPASSVDAHAGSAAASPRFSVRDLCTVLRRIEKRHET